MGGLADVTEPPLSRRVGPLTALRACAELQALEPERFGPRDLFHNLTDKLVVHGVSL